MSVHPSDNDPFRGCAYCTARTAERYEEFPRCTECGEHVCDHCVPSGAAVDTDYDYGTGTGHHEWTVPCTTCAMYDLARQIETVIFS